MSHLINLFWFQIGRIHHYQGLELWMAELTPTPSSDGPASGHEVCDPVPSGSNTSIILHLD